MTVITKTLVRDGSGRAVSSTVGVSVGEGRPSFEIYGLGAADSRLILGPLVPALRVSGFDGPASRVTVTITPLPKMPRRSREPESVSLAVALAYLAETGQVPADAVDGGTFVGSVTIAGMVDDPGLRMGPKIHHLSEARDLPSLGRLPKGDLWERCCDVVASEAERELGRALGDRPGRADRDASLCSMLMHRYVSSYRDSRAIRDALLSELTRRGEPATTSVLTRAIEAMARDQALDDIALLDGACVARGLESARYAIWVALKEGRNPCLEETVTKPSQGHEDRDHEHRKGAEPR